MRVLAMLGAVIIIGLLSWGCYALYNYLFHRTTKATVRVITKPSGDDDASET